MKLSQFPPLHLTDDNPLHKKYKLNLFPLCHFFLHACEYFAASQDSTSLANDHRKREKTEFIDERTLWA